MRLGYPAGTIAAVAGTVVASYALGWSGFALSAPVAFGAGGLAGVALGLAVGRRVGAPAWPWLLVIVAIAAMTLWPAWPDLLPRGGASDLTHHLLLVDVLERTRHLVDGAASEAALGEMAHYTPGVHLLIVLAGSLAGVEAYRVAYPVLALTIALKGGFVFLIAFDALSGVRGRVPFALTAVGLVLFAPRAYVIDGVLGEGFYAQVASELFVTAGWWGVARWWTDRAPAWMAFAGLMGAAAFLTWPIWIGPLVVAGALALLAAPDLSPGQRLKAGGVLAGPIAVASAMHLARHAAWLRLAGTSGAVPAVVTGPLGWALLALAVVGWTTAFRRTTAARVTVWLTLGLAAQALALYALARARGAETAYMATKMIYLAVYPLAVLGAVGLETIARPLPRLVPVALMVLVCGVGLSRATSGRVPPAMVDVDLHDAGRWARANLQAGCVDYIVDNAEQAYWLHLAVMGEPRSSPRTAAIDGYTTNRALGRWIEGTAPPYAVARRALLPGEVLSDTEVIRAFGSAVVIKRRGGGC